MTTEHDPALPAVRVRGATGEMEYGVPMKPADAEGLLVLIEGTELEHLKAKLQWVLDTAASDAERAAAQAAVEESE